MPGSVGMIAGIFFGLMFVGLSIGVTLGLSGVIGLLQIGGAGLQLAQVGFGSLELGVAVPNRADPWTRMSYAGPNKPIAPITDPYQMYQKLYGQLKDKESLQSILDDVQADLPLQMWVYPASDRAAVPELFRKAAPIPRAPAVIEPAVIDRKRDAWIRISGRDGTGAASGAPSSCSAVTATPWRIWSGV